MVLHVWWKIIIEWVQVLTYVYLNTRGIDRLITQSNLKRVLTLIHLIVHDTMNYIDSFDSETLQFPF